MTSQTIRVLLVENDAQTAEQVKSSLAKSETTRFVVTWVNSGELAVTTLHQNHDIDVLITDYYLPGMNGAQLARAVLKELNPALPIVFLTTNKDMYLVIEVMKLGVKDYLFRESIESSLFAQTIMSIVDKARLKREMEELDRKRRRLDAMQEVVVQISGEISEPLQKLRTVVQSLLEGTNDEKARKYLVLIKENIERLELKMDKLRNLKEDKTVQYIKDIRMLDLS